MISVRIDGFWRKIFHRWHFVFGMLLLAVSLLICLFPSNVQAEEVISAASNEAITPCKGLKPFDNLDELLYQFYINLESDCLSKMTPSELEKIWNIKIVSAERAGKGNSFSALVESAEFRGKPYESDKDAFYVKMWEKWGKEEDNIFWIEMTDAYKEKYDSLFPDGKFPKLLPDPIIRPVMPPFHGPKSTWHCRQYYWENSAKTRTIKLLGDQKYTSVTIGPNRTWGAICTPPQFNFKY